MSMDSYTEVTQQSWFSRIGSAIKGVLFGIVLLIAAFPFLFWNEGRAISRTIALEEGQAAVQSVASDSVNEQLSNQLIHVTGKVIAPGQREDALFGISTEGLSLLRTVEMYQWIESSEQTTEKKLGGGTETKTTYHYRTQWHEGLVNSSSFKNPQDHTNPTDMPYRSQSWRADNARLGAFQLSSAQVSQIGHREPLYPQQVPENLQKHFNIVGQYLYQGQDTNPQVGDVRVSFYQVPEQDASIVAQQAFDRLVPFKTSNGGTIELIQTGVHSAPAMFEKSHSDNMLLTWGLRFAGFIIMFIALNLIFKPLSVLADVVPFIGNMVGIGTGLIAFVLSLCLTLVTIAIAWIMVRPLIGGILLVMAVVSLGVIVLKSKKSSTQKVVSVAS